MTDLHANAVAVQAVIDDGWSCGVDRWIVLGDVAVMGADPVEVIGLLADLDSDFGPTVFVAGNGERYLLAGDRPPPHAHHVDADPRLIGQALEVAGSFTWTTGAVESHGLLPWFGRFVAQHRETLSGGSRLLAVHASAIADDGPGIEPRTPPEEYRRLFPDGRRGSRARGAHARADRRGDRGGSIREPRQRQQRQRVRQASGVPPAPLQRGR